MFLHPLRTFWGWRAERQAARIEAQFRANAAQRSRTHGIVNDQARIYMLGVMVRSNDPRFQVEPKHILYNWAELLDEMCVEGEDRSSYEGQACLAAEFASYFLQDPEYSSRIEVTTNGRSATVVIRNIDGNGQLDLIFVESPEEMLYFVYKKKMNIGQMGPEKYIPKAVRTRR